MKRALFAIPRRVLAKVRGPRDELGPQKLAAQTVAAQRAALERERYRTRHGRNGSAAGSAAGHGQRFRPAAEPLIGRPDPDRGLGDGDLIQTNGVPAGVLRRAAGIAGRVLVVLLSLATFVIWWEVVPNHRTLSRQGLLVAAVVALVTAVATGATMVRTRKGIARLREQGLTTTATITKVEERYVAIPYSYNGWVTRITVSFTDIRGGPVRAHYTDYCRAGGKHEGQAIQIVYDPKIPTSLSPVGRCSRPEDPRSFEAILIAPAVLVSLGISIYFAYRAIG